MLERKLQSMLETKVSA